MILELWSAVFWNSPKKHSNLEYCVPFAYFVVEVNSRSFKKYFAKNNIYVCLFIWQLFLSAIKLQNWGYLLIFHYYEMWYCRTSWLAILLFQISFSPWMHFLTFCVHCNLYYNFRLKKIDFSRLVGDVPNNWLVTKKSEWF